MAGPFRLVAGGSQIDRARPVRFTFDGRPVSGYAGDTIAAALLGAGVSVVGRSLKFHRPRGVLSAGVEEPNALVTLGSGARRTPSVRATVEPIADGLEVRSQNAWPSLDFDLGRINDLVHGLYPAGFYNKTFIWPNWHTFEAAIRHMAGLGVAADAPDPDRYEWRNAHCDVLVVGAGLAGRLAAALAAQVGARVLLVEGAATLDGEWNPPPGVHVSLHTTAVGVYDHGLVTAIETRTGATLRSEATPPRVRQRWWRIRAKQVVLATGAFEQPLAFAFNDRPGIMLADAARRYLQRHGVAIGGRVAVATNNDSAYRVAFDLRAAGIEVPCLLDTRTAPDVALLERARGAGIEVHSGARIDHTWGDRRIAGLEFTRESRGGGGPTRVRCDALAMSGGWNPVAHLYCQAGGKLRFDPHAACLVPDGRLDALHAVGAAAAQFELHAALAHVRDTLDRVLAALGRPAPTEVPQWAQVPPGAPPGATGALGDAGPARRNRAWVDFQHDATVADIDLSVRENLVSVEHVKRYTTAGMSIDQGKTANLNVLAILAAQTSRSMAEVGTTTFRPPFVPVTLGAIAGGRNGRFYRPMRLLPAHAAHAALGAHFDDYGGWQRPACYPASGATMAQSIAREVRAVRSAVGLFEATPLGKFLVRGTDAAEFLNRIYANTQRTLEPGRVRYGIMLNEQGVIIDDGVCARLAADEFWVNTTGAGAARIGAWFEEWLQGEWPGLQVVTTDVTSAWATLTLAGPRAREVLAALPCDIDLGREAFPHMHVRSGHICGVPCRILRVSFSGELSYEISVPADRGHSLWNVLLAAGRPFGIVPYGIESLLTMRIEKGYLHVGSETDGTSIPDDIGFGTPVAKKTGEFVGRRSLSLPEHSRADRLQLVGLRCTGEPAAFTAGAHLVEQVSGEGPAQSCGYLTSACHSPTLDQHLGLGLLRRGRARIGATVQVMHGGVRTQALVVAPAHYDPTGARLDG
jgi:sarcosine oxidase subunit alpha